MLVLGMSEHVLFEEGEMVRRNGLVVVPPDCRLGRLIAQDEFVIGRTAGVAASLDHQRTAIRHATFAPPERFFVKLGRTRIEGDGARLLYDQGNFRVEMAHMVHAILHRFSVQHAET